MIVWETTKRWRYRGRNCEIQRASVAGTTQYRGLVALGTDVPDRALETAPVTDPRRKRRPVRREDDEYRVWVCFGWSGEEVPDLREDVNRLAEHVDSAEV